MTRLKIDVRSLSAQMVMSLVALVVLTAVAAALPALWLVGGELERQAWSQVDQGARGARALYAAREGEVGGLALLTAERPTLRQLLATGDRAALGEYIATLQAGARLDVLAVCGLSGEPLAQAGARGADACAWLPGAEVAPPSYIVTAGAAPQAWLLAAQPVGPTSGDRPGRVIVGIQLDQEFAGVMRMETGLEHRLLAGGALVASSLPGATPASSQQETLDLDGRPYYGRRIALVAPGLEAEVLLPVSDLADTRRRLAWTVAGSVVVVAAVGSLLGLLLARRIGRPLTRLAGAAAALSTGDLDRPIRLEARVREVALVAQALEGARAGLQGSLAALRQEKEWTEHLLEAIVEGIVTLDRQGRITFFSQGAERITGWRRDQVLGRSCDHVLRPVGTAESFSQLIPAPGGQNKIAVELPGGRQALLSVTGARLLPPEGNNARVALVFRDVTEQEAVHRVLGDFLANVTHEFRTPLSAVAASVELLLDQAPDLSPDELQELLTSLHLGILGLETLVDNLLESASIETGHFRVYARPSDLADIIGEAIRVMQPLIAKHDQRLVVDLPAAIPVVHADPRRIVQVLVNLLSNAAKYGRDGAEVTVCASMLPGDGRLRVSVADQGPGIPADTRRVLFRRFARPGEDGDKTRTGAGLGLSVVKAVVEAHGGQVGIDDRAGGGAVFWFTLSVAGEP